MQFIAEWRIVKVFVSLFYNNRNKAEGEII